MKSMPPQVIFKFLFFCLLLLNSSTAFAVQDQEDVSLVDEASCICGINSEVLARLETIVKLASADQTCGVNAPSQESQISESASNLNIEPDRSEDPQAFAIQTSDERPAVSLVVAQQSTEPSSLGVNGPTGINTEEALSSTSLSAQALQHIISKLTAEIHQLEMQYQSLAPQPSNVTPESQLNPAVLLNEDQHTVGAISSSNGEEQVGKPIVVANVGYQPENNGFLGGLTTSAIQSSNSAMMKLNQSQNVNPQEMSSALQSTIPGVVSNIFTSIQNLTIQAGQNKTVASNTLTSIDGSSVNIKGDSSEQIEAEGEKLFLLWIEHQIDTLHLTASMANYIRKSALSLFRGIVRQYVERVKKLGGNIESNVQLATQMALNNTQNLISFLLRNYLNFAGGIMQIIGEQVSRVGKQLDSTGETIAHISLNPFDIVSSVIESLPNPSSYAEYFRAFGKQLIGGDYSAPTQAQSAVASTVTQQQPTDKTPVATQKPESLLSKTVGALSKTLGSWIG